MTHVRHHRRRRPGRPRVPRSRRHDREGRPPHQGGRGAAAPRWSRSPRASCRPIPTGCGARTRGPTASGTPAGSTSASTCPVPACDALGDDRARERGVPRGPRERTRRRHRLQHDPLLRSRRHAARQAPQARRDRRRAPRVGHGRRLDAAGVRHAVRSRSAGSICWENYMPLARVAMYEQHVDILLAPTWDNSDVWVVVDAPHREGRTLLRARHHVVPARLRRSRRHSRAATRSTAATTTGCHAATR